MRLRSMGLRSDLAQLDGEILDRGDYLFVRSPGEPEFHWGNLLVFPGPPRAGDFGRWQNLFDREFQAWPEIRHRTFAWDCSDVEEQVDDFVRAGYRFEKSAVFSASKVMTPRYQNQEVEIRTVSGEADWRALEECQLLCRDDVPEVGYEEFVRKRLLATRTRVERGEGCFYGAYQDGKMVASLGVFSSDNMGRFQTVVTIPTARRAGICATLVHHASLESLALPHIEHLLLVADEDYHAGRIYESLGFRKSEELRGLCLWPDTKGQ